jgi:alpha-amylase
VKNTFKTLSRSGGPSVRQPRAHRSSLRRSATLGLCALAGLGGVAQAQPLNLSLLQWFEQEWDDMERRVPDFFMAGYGGLWVPPPSKASFASPGYDPFDRFDLGQPPLAAFTSGRARTTYGTEATFKAMVDEIHRANGLVYIDGIFNHNDGRTESDAFLADGGYPGFWIPRESPPRNKRPTDDWGDFHSGNGSGYLQSENPGGSNFDLHVGDLVALVDIAQETNNQFIRQPVAAGNPANIPAGTSRNRPDPNNARLYPDRQLTPKAFTNPGTSRNPGAQGFVRYPFNTASPLAGDAVSDNATGMLMRWAQWMMQVQGIDGFRLDALKHTPSFFWDTFFDASVYKTWIRPDGTELNPLTFGENISGNGEILANYVRKDSFANRDALDIQGAARLRDLLNAGGFGSWQSLTSSSDSGLLDFADDGFINGSMGMNHVFSHDNGTAGNGGSVPPIPTARQHGLAMNAYMLMTPGRGIVYHNGRQVSRTSGFYPRAGLENALGYDPTGSGIDDAITTLLNIRNEVGYGFYYQLGGVPTDVLVFERANSTRTNCLVAVNDRWDAGATSLTVSTRWPQGTRIHELTGNAANPTVDPGSTIPELITVGAGGQVTLSVPRNSSIAGEHGRGYVVYAEALPAGTLTFEGQTGLIPADPPNFPVPFRRLNDIPVVSGDSFTIRLDTTRADPGDAATDDNALFRIDQGTDDWNSSGGVDFPLAQPVIGGYEQFVTTNQPLFGSGGSAGLYRQTIDATRLDEGTHYLSVIAFKERPSGSSPIFSEFREVIYVDREPPLIAFVEDGQTVETAYPILTVLPLDRTTERIYAFINLPPEADPVTLINNGDGLSRYDRFEWRGNAADPLLPGTNRVTIVATEQSGNARVLEGTLFLGADCPADVNGDGVVDNGDIGVFISLFLSGDPAADFTGDSVIDNGDIGAFITAFLAGC